MVLIVARPSRRRVDGLDGRRAAAAHDRAARRGARDGGAPHRRGPRRPARCRRGRGGRARARRSAHAAAVAPRAHLRARHEAQGPHRAGEAGGDPREARRAAAPAVPLRIRVLLQSGLPAEAVRVRIFDELTTNGSDKYLQWVSRRGATSCAAGQDPAARPSTSACRARPSPSAARPRARGHGRPATSRDTRAKREVLKLVCQMRSGGADAPAYALGLEGAPGREDLHAARAALGRPRPAAGDWPARRRHGHRRPRRLGQMYTSNSRQPYHPSRRPPGGRLLQPHPHFDERGQDLDHRPRRRDHRAVLLHIVDPSMNTHLRDRYFHGIDLDFSRCVFVFTYNDASKVSVFLLDRIRRVTVPTPSRAERVAIVRDHLRRARSVGCTRRCAWRRRHRRPPRRRRGRACAASRRTSTTCSAGAQRRRRRRARPRPRRRGRRLAPPAAFAADLAAQRRPVAADGAARRRAVMYT